MKTNSNGPLTFHEFVIKINVRMSRFESSKLILPDNLTHKMSIIKNAARREIEVYECLSEAENAGQDMVTLIETLARTISMFHSDSKMMCNEFMDKAQSITTFTGEFKARVIIFNKLFACQY